MQDKKTSFLARVASRTLVPLLALLILFEEWGWDPLSRFLGKMARLPVWGAIERLIVRLPPYAALLTFLLPVLALIPIKLIAWYWVAQGYALLGLSVVLAAKLLGTAIVARLFTLTQPALMRLPWFARLYTRWKNWKDAMMVRVKCMPHWQAFVARKRRWGRRSRCALMRVRRAFGPA